MERTVENILKELEKRGLSQTWLAREAGYSQVTVNRLLNGTTKRPDRGLVRRLCEVLEIGEDVSGNEKAELSQEDQENLGLIKRLNARKKRELRAELYRLLAEQERESLNDGK